MKMSRFFGKNMLTEIRGSVQEELQSVLTVIRNATVSDIELVQTIQHYVLNQPEKKLIRPLIIILLAKASQYNGEQHIILAAIIELIHGATLLHDDVIDKAAIRRNKITTHKQFGTTESILMGDYIYASAFQLIAKLHDPAITSTLSTATKEIVEGEILQLSLQGNHLINLDQYMQIIRSKTALLFSTGAQCIQLPPNNHYPTLKDYGYHFGMLYQITDDILDTDIHNQQLNKTCGTDLKEGKMTLPSIIAFQKGDISDKQCIQTIIKGQEDWRAILPILDKTNAIQHCHPYLHHHLQQGLKALESLPDTVYKKHLQQLLHHIPNRKV